MGSSGRSIVFLNQKTIQLTGKRSEQPLTDFRLSTAPYFLGFGWTFDSLPPTTTTIQLPIHFVSSHHLPFSFSSFVMPQPDYLAPPRLTVLSHWRMASSRWVPDNRRSPDPNSAHTSNSFSQRTRPHFLSSSPCQKNCFLPLAPTR